MKATWHIVRGNWKVVVTIAIALATMGGYWLWHAQPAGPQTSDLSTIQQMLVNKEVTQVTIDDTTHSIVATTQDGSQYQATFVEQGGGDLQTQLLEQGVPFTVTADEQSWFGKYGFVLFYAVFMIVLIGTTSFARPLTQKLRKRVLGSPDFAAEVPEERFADVQGADEAIEEFRLVVAWLQDPDAYAALEINRGYILYGPPGTGKTMISKAVAGEAGVHYWRLAGAELVGKWAGQTSEQIGQFFREVKTKLKTPDAKAIIHIDEIDGIASSREGGSGSDRDRNTSVTMFIEQIDRLFEEYPHVILIATTNLIDSIDEAVKRPGRLGKHIPMPNPDFSSRVLILQQNSVGHDIPSGALSAIARLTAGFSGAAVAGIPKEAARISARTSGPGRTLTARDLELAAMDAVLGTPRKSAAVSPSEVALSATHEAGHSVVAHASPYHQLIFTTTYPVGISGGSTWSPPLDDQLPTEDSVLWQLAVLMGGREAEKLYQPSLSAGGTSDIEEATNLALMAVCRYGLYPEFGTSIDPRDWSEHPRAAEIDAKVQLLLSTASTQAGVTIMDHQALFMVIRDELTRQRILHSDQLATLVAEHAPLAA